MHLGIDTAPRFDLAYAGMNPLARVFAFKIVATVLAWCLPLLLLPASALHALGLPPQDSTLFLRLLGWAYLSLCVGYGFGLRAALAGRRAPGPVWVGLVSNLGACLLLAGYGASGAWTHWGVLLQGLLWASVLATAAISVGLYLYGVRGTDEGAD